MDIFYIDTENFKSTHKKDFLEQFADIELKTEKRFYEYTIGRYLVKSVGEKVFGLSNTEIIKNKEGKPIFKNADIHFNISHSKGYVVAVFDNFPCGIDIEYIKPRDLGKLSKYYNREFTSLTNFYEFWTQKEATYKLGITNGKTYTTLFKETYSLTVASKIFIKFIELTEFY